MNQNPSTGTKKRLTMIKIYSRETGGAPPKELTEVEKLIIDIAGENKMLGMKFHLDSFADVRNNKVVRNHL